MHAALRTLLALTLTILATSEFASTSAAEKPPAPKTAQELLARVAKQLHDLSAYSCQADVVIEVRSEGVDNDLESSYAIRVDKPRRWAIELNSGVIGGSSVSDGKEVATYLSLSKKYTVAPLSADWSPSDPDAFSPPALAMALGPAGFPQYLMGRDFQKALSEPEVKSSLDKKTLGSVQQWVTRFELPGAQVELWVPEGSNDPLRQIVITPDLGADGAEKVSMRIRVTFRDWQTKPKFVDADFAFDPPAGAEKSDSLMGDMMAEEGPHPLVGKPAPLFEAEVLLDGKTFKLADALKGKEKVVMLDFWATWCPPCVDALPQVTAVAKDLEARGIVFFAVNIEEEPDAVRQFLANHDLRQTPVLLDADGAITAKYRASAVPQTVLIGKDGRVQVVHVGGRPDLKQVLLADLKQLIAGKDLAAETLDKQRQKEESPADENDADDEADDAAPAGQP